MTDASTADLPLSEDGVEAAIGMITGEPPKGYDSWEQWVNAEAKLLLASIEDDTTPDWVRQSPPLYAFLEDGNALAARMIAAASVLKTQFDEQAHQARMIKPSPTYNAVDDEDASPRWATIIAEETLTLLRDKHGIVGELDPTAQYVIEMRAELAASENITLSEAQQRLNAETMVHIIEMDIREEMNRNQPDAIVSPEPNRHPTGWLTGENILWDDVENLINRVLHREMHRHPEHAEEIDATAYATSRTLLNGLASEWTKPVNVLLVLMHDDTETLCLTHLYRPDPQWYALSEDYRNPTFMIPTHMHGDEIHSVFGSPTPGSGWDRMMVLLALTGGALTVHDISDPRTVYAKWIVRDHQIVNPDAELPDN